MILYYAMGGGLGHLTRADAFIHMYNISDFRIITASPFSTRLFHPGNLIQIPEDFENHPDHLTAHLQDILNKTKADAVFIDTFSHGILGELNEIRWGHSEVNYVTRRVKWNIYSPRVKNRIMFNKTYILESLEPAHKRWIERDTGKLIEVQIQYPSYDIKNGSALMKPGPEEKWVIVHSWPENEIQELMNRAKEAAIAEGKNPEFYLISQGKELSDRSIKRLDTFHAHGYFRFADRIFSACGFNIMNQMMNDREKHWFFPFERRYDDQHWRAGEAGKKNRNS